MVKHHFVNMKSSLQNDHFSFLVLGTGVKMSPLPSWDNLANLALSMRKKNYSSFGHKILTELKQILLGSNYKTVYEPVRIDRSSYRVPKVFVFVSVQCVQFCTFTRSYQSGYVSILVATSVNTPLA